MSKRGRQNFISNRFYDAHWVFLNDADDIDDDFSIDDIAGVGYVGELPLPTELHISPEKPKAKKNKAAYPPKGKRQVISYTFGVGWCIEKTLVGGHITYTVVSNAELIVYIHARFT